MWMWIVNLFAGPFGAVLTKIVEGAFIVATLAGLYYVITQNAINTQKFKDQAEVQKVIIEQQQKFIDETQKIIDFQNKTQAELDKTISDLRYNSALIDKMLQDPNLLKTDRPSSEILKKTIDAIQKEKVK